MDVSWCFIYIVWPWYWIKSYSNISFYSLNLFEESYFSFWVLSEHGNEIKIYNFSQSNTTKAKGRHADHFLVLYSLYSKALMRFGLKYIWDIIIKYTFDEVSHKNVKRS